MKTLSAMMPNRKKIHASRSSTSTWSAQTPRGVRVLQVRGAGRARGVVGGASDRGVREGQRVRLVGGGAGALPLGAQLFTRAAKGD